MSSKSRIPRPPPSRLAQLSTNAAAALTLIDIDLQASLTALHAPPISSTDLARLASGPLGTALCYIVEHVKGREGTARARRLLHRAYGDSEVKRRLSDTGTELAYVAEKRAAARLAAAQRALVALQSELDERGRVIEHHQEEEGRLRVEIARQRRMNMLLGVLESKEDIRMRRFKETVRILDAARMAVNNSSNKQGVPSKPIVENSNSSKKSSRPTYTRDALASLQAYHIRLAAQPSQPLPYDPISVPRANPDALLRSLDVKARELQALSDKCAAYEALCAQLTQTTTLFAKTTSHTLASFFDTDAPRARGCVEVLQRHISALSTSNIGDSGVLVFEREVKRVCGLRGEVSVPRIVREVHCLITEAHRQASFMSGAVLAPPTVVSEDDALIKTYKADAREAKERAERVLAQAIMAAREEGDALVQNVERLAWEMREVGGLLSTFGSTGRRGKR